MHHLTLSIKARAATLLLVLCLQLRISRAQDDEKVREALILNLDFPRTAVADELVTLTLTIGTQLRECMVVKAYLITLPALEGPVNYIQTRCICNDYPTNLFWDFSTNKTVIIKTTVDIVKVKGICPQDIAVVPISADRYYSSNILFVY